jgi:uncharacterized membrane protein
MLLQVVVSAVVLLVLDSIFIYLLSQVFVKQVFEVQHSPLKLNYAGAAFTYVLLIFALNYFILTPKKTVLDAFFLGIIVYGVFEGTNLALLKNWKLSTVMIDTLWGGTLLAASTFITRFILKAVQK